MYLSQSSRWFKLLFAPVIALVILFTLQEMMSSLLSIPPVAAQPTNEIEDGDFETGDLSHWILIGDASHHTYLDPPYNGAAAIAGGGIYQVITPPSTGVYHLEFECKRKSTDVGMSLTGTVSPSKANVAEWDAVCSDKGNWDLKSGDLLLEANTAYTITFVSNQTTYYLDNVSLVKVSDIVDIPTGLITNGDFIGPDGWEYVDGEAVMHVGANDYITTTGAAGLAGNGIYQVVTPSSTGVYHLEFVCKRKSMDIGMSLTGKVTSSKANTAEWSMECDDSGYWNLKDANLLLEANTAYTVTFFSGQTSYYLDNVSLIKIWDETEIDIQTGLITNGD
ncbi:MAG: hypothetical protein GY803_04725, partial [Chloroflexi bacterium]|nr:hypothetical protein [Chloroflexota bacterium]